MNALPVFLRLKGRPVILIGEGEAAGAKRVLLERAGAIIVNEQAGAALAIVAVDEDMDAIVSRLKARGILVNAVDRPDLCDFTLPAIVDREPVIVAVGTGGASAGLAKALRQGLEDWLPASLGLLATQLNGARAAIREKWPDARDRRRAIDAALAPNGPLDLRAQQTDVAGWLALTQPKAGTSDSIQTFLIEHDDPDQLTVQQARLLGEADTVYHAPMIAPAILHRARADATRIAWSSRKSPVAKGTTVYLVRAFSLK